MTLTLVHKRRAIYLRASDEQYCILFRQHCCVWIFYRQLTPDAAGYDPIGAINRLDFFVELRRMNPHLAECDRLLSSVAASDKGCCERTQTTTSSIQHVHLSSSITGRY